MFRKINLLFFAGLLILIFGVALSPSFVESFTSDGRLESDLTIIFIQIIRILSIISGVFLIVLSLIINKSEKKTKVILIALSILGFLYAAAGAFLSPQYIRMNFSRIGYFEDTTKSLFLNLQLLIITFSLLLFLIPLLIYVSKYSTRKIRYSVLLVLSFVILYFFAFYGVYLNTKYPSNILFKPSEYGKVYNLVLGKDILLSDFEPRSNLKVAYKHLYKPKFPVIDCHFHFASVLQSKDDKKVLAPESLIKTMDSVGVKLIVNLDDNGDIESMLNRYARRYPDKFINFLPFKFTGIKSDEWFAKRANLFENGVKLGARGLKVIKALGLKTRDSHGKLVPVDDPRLDPLWSKVEQLGLPVLWHLADPTPFFQPIDRHNERYTEMHLMPEWSFYGPDFPSKETVLMERENVLKKHPKLIVIGAHMGGCADNLKYVGYLLDTYPNFYVEFSSTLTDLGIQPYTARKFFIKYQDRILFGSDGGVRYNIKGWTLEKFYRRHFEFLETDNEFFDYPMKGAVEQGTYKIYGLNLPDEVLEKIYYKNAEKIIVRNQTNPGSSFNFAHVEIK